MEIILNIEEFSKAIGVSPTTVSHAFSGRGNLSKATRERVLLKSRELGYVPNSNARRLAKGKSNLVTLSWLTSAIGEHSFVMEAIYSLISPFREREYDLVLDIVPDSPRQRSMMIERARSQAEDALIMYDGDWLPTDFLAELALPAHPVINMGMNTLAAIPNTASVKWSSSNQVGQLVDYLLEMGHTRFGVISQYERDQGSLDLVNIVRSRGINLGDTSVIFAGEHPADGDAAMDTLMSLPNPPTAVLTRTDVLAMGAIKAAHRRGLRVPDDVSVSGQDDLPLASALYPPITTIRIDLPEVAKAVAAAAFRLMSDPASEPQSIISECKLIIRDSTGQAPGLENA